MRTLKRNQIPFTYQLYLGEQEERDEYGNLNGNRHILYSDPVPTKGNVAFGGSTYRALSGSEYRPFGIEDDYSATIIPNQPLPIDTASRLNIKGKEFIVVRVTDTVNSQTIYAKER